MDFPIYHLDFLNNRMLIAVVAILHVIINHAMAVGGIPIVVYLERKAFLNKDARWDHLAKKVMFIFFIITTTIGAMSGVGIWVTASLVNPAAIGSLLRVFFWAWAIEWVVFITEVCLILWYFLSWKEIGHAQKKSHVRLGIFLAAASWITMAIIVSILGFMMDTGAWTGDGSLLSALFNPVYLPQLAFRTPLAMVFAGAMALAFIPFFSNNSLPEKHDILRLLGKWTLAWSAPFALGALWYRNAIPAYSVGNMQVAITTQAFADWYQQLLIISGIVCVSIILIALACIFIPKRVGAVALVAPAVGVAAMLGLFERVREFIRKPYAIQGYLYSNGYRAEDYPLMKRDGILRHSTFAAVREVTSENTLVAGEEVFRLACSRCHTVTGINSIRKNIGAMYGFSANWDPEIISSYIETMHNGRAYMPPFPGNAKERKALAEYLVQLQSHVQPLKGVQDTGIQGAVR
ncbi:cytochrome c [bacterium]|nr:cytochrome c [bacterium]